MIFAPQLKKGAKKSFFSRKKKHISDESRDSSSDLGSQKDKNQKEVWIIGSVTFDLRF